MAGERLGRIQRAILEGVKEQSRAVQDLAWCYYNREAIEYEDREHEQAPEEMWAGDPQRALEVSFRRAAHRLAEKGLVQLSYQNTMRAAPGWKPDPYPLCLHCRLAQEEPWDSSRERLRGEDVRALVLGLLADAGEELGYSELRAEACRLLGSRWSSGREATAVGRAVRRLVEEGKVAERVERASMELLYHNPGLELQGKIVGRFYALAES